MKSVNKAIISILIIAGATVWLVYRYSPSRNQMKTRTQDEKEYYFKCEGGHEFKDFGRKSPRPCTVQGCTKEAHIYMIFSCPRYHRIGVLLKTNPDEYRFEKYSSDINWQPFNIDDFFTVPCPECSTPGLRPAPESPL